MVSWCQNGGYDAQIYPKSELCGFKWANTTNVSMTLCNWQSRHQTHVLCGCTTFGTESNQVPSSYGRFAYCSLDKAAASSRCVCWGGVGGGVHVAVVADLTHTAA